MHQSAEIEVYPEMKFRVGVRISPEILTKDRRPQQYAILDPQSVRVHK